MLQRNFKYDKAKLSEEELLERTAPFGVKFQWFLEKGYQPHYFQLVFHTMQNEATQLLRFRHLVAGRRGGKTLSAAWEVLFYCLHPSEFHWDAHGIKEDRPLHVWVLTANYPLGRAAWDTFYEVIKTAGLIHGQDYKMNKGDRYFEFTNGTRVDFKTGDNPQNLRGAGLDILWIDEAAFLPDKEAYETARPALSDKDGITITTTTPAGKNWFYSMFWSAKALEDRMMGRVEYRSIDNPYFSRKEWEYLLETYHPLLFKQEFMAAFDSMAGRELHGDWLKFYVAEDIPTKADGKSWDLNYFIGVDPAISLAEDADHFAMAVIGVTKDNTQVFLIDLLKDRVPFPDQVDLIQEWFLKFRPMYIGVEAVAYQRALVQQLERLPTLPPIVPVFSKGDKSERILRMAPLFKIGKVRILEGHKDFIDEWINYDTTLKNPHDDALDAVEIALSSVGNLLPSMKEVVDRSDMPPSDLNEWASRQIPGKFDGPRGPFDEEMGEDW